MMAESQRIQNLELKVNILEKRIQTMESAFNRKFKWVINNLTNNQNQRNAANEQQRRGILQSQLQLGRIRPRILSKPMIRRPIMNTSPSPTLLERFIIPEVQLNEYGDDDDEGSKERAENDQLNSNDNDDNEQESESQSNAKWISPEADINECDSDDNENNDNDRQDVEDGQNNFYDETSQTNSEDPLAIDEGDEPQERDDHDNGNIEEQEEEGQRSNETPWRFEQNDDDNDEREEPEEEDENEFEYEKAYASTNTNSNPNPPNKLRILNFIDGKPYRIISKNQLNQNVKIESLAQRNFSIKKINSGNQRQITNYRFIQPKPAYMSNKPNILSKSGKVYPGGIVSKNRYLMSVAAASRLNLQQNSIARSLTQRDGKLRTFFKPEPRVRKIPQSEPSSSNLVSPYDNEKIYKCDRCPGTFTLATRKAHLELHQNLPTTKKLVVSNNNSTSSQIQIKPKPSTSSPSSTTVVRTMPKLVGHFTVGETNNEQQPRATRIRPRKVCPICSKSYSRNQYLRSHLNEHDADYPYICKECFLVCRNSQEFEKHCEMNDKCFMSIHHP